MTDEITVSRGFTRNLGNFESARYDAWYKTEVRDGETEQEAYDRAKKFVEENVTADVEADN